MAVHRVERFTGDGSTKNFTLLGPIATDKDSVYVGGIRQPRTTGYTLSANKKTVQMVLAPANGEDVTVAYMEADS